MGYKKTDVDRKFVQETFGWQWDMVHTTPDMFNRFCDFAVRKTGAERTALVNRLRVMVSRKQEPSAFVCALLLGFLEEGGHLGLSRYFEDGVSYYCREEEFEQFRRACLKHPAYPLIGKWVLQDFHGEQCVVAHPSAPLSRGKVLEQSGSEMLISREKRKVIIILEEQHRSPVGMWDFNDFPAFFEAYKLLSTVFGRFAAVAIPSSLDESAIESLCAGLSSPPTSVSRSRLRPSVISLAVYCAAGEPLEGRVFARPIRRIFQRLERQYSHLQVSHASYADYLYYSTESYMPKTQRYHYLQALAEFEYAMEVVFRDHSGEIRDAVQEVGGKGLRRVCAVAPASCPTGTFGPAVVKEVLMPTNFFKAYWDAFSIVVAWRGRPEGRRPGAPIDLLKILREDSELTNEGLAVFEQRFCLPPKLFLALEQLGEVSVSDLRNRHGVLRFRGKDWERPAYFAVSCTAGSHWKQSLEGHREEFYAACRLAQNRILSRI